MEEKGEEGELFRTPDTHKIVLGSSSPFRRVLLTELLKGGMFEILSPDIDEYAVTCGTAA